MGSSSPEQAVAEQEAEEEVLSCHRGEEKFHCHENQSWSKPVEVMQGYESLQQLSVTLCRFNNKSLTILLFPAFASGPGISKIVVVSVE